MAFMKLEITRKGTLAMSDCKKCGQTHYAHEWTSWDFNEERDTLQETFTLCSECFGLNDIKTYREQENVYAGRYSAPGYLDCTDWHYDTNKRRLEKKLRDMYA